MITSRQLEAFRAIMEHGTVTAAAERLGVSQPAVSKILAGLELEIGYPLFTRIKRRLAPTSEARLLAAEVTRLYHSLDRISEMAREIRDRQVGDLHVYSTPALGRTVLDHPHWPWDAAHALGAEIARPLQYARVYFR